MFKSNPKAQHIDDSNQIRIVLRKLQEKWTPIQIVDEEEKGQLTLIQEEENALFFSLAGFQGGKAPSPPGSDFAVKFFYEGKQYQTCLKCLGTGKLDGTAAVKTPLPKRLHINDRFQLTNFHLGKPCPVIFTNHFNKVLDAEAINISEFGVDIHSHVSLREDLKEGETTFLTIQLDPKTSFKAGGKVLYFVDYGMSLSGIEFTKIEESQRKSILNWLKDQHIHKAQKERQTYLTNWVPPVKRMPPPQDAPTRKKGYDFSDYPTVFVEGEPSLLLVGTDHDMLKKLGESLGDRFGILLSKGRFQNLEEIVSTHQPKMILIAEKVGSASGFDLCRTILDRIVSDMPILMLGDKQGSDEKRNRALSVGAVDFIPTKPFLVHFIREQIVDLYKAFETTDDSSI